MANYQIPISYVVSASAVLPQAGIEPLKLSTILILTDDEPVNELTNDYGIYRTVTAVTQDWGTEGEIAKMAQAIFSQSPNILNNDGYLIVAPYSNVAATSGTLTTKDLTANVNKFKTVANGSLKLTIDGVAKQITNLNFSNVNTLDDIANVIQQQLDNATVEVNGDTLIFTSNTTGVNSTITMATSSAGTDIYGVNYLDGAQAITVNGQAERIEKYSEGITRLATNIYFNGVQTTRELSDAEAIEASNVNESLKPNRILFLENKNAKSLTPVTGLFAQVVNNKFTRTLYYTTDEAKLFASAYASKLLSVNYNGFNTCITMNLKDLAGITADTNISENVLNQCVAVGADCFPSVEGLAKVLSNKKGGYYADQIQNSIWLINSVQRNVFNLLATTRTKIPQTEPGMQLITNAISQILRQGITNGYLAPGTWNSADTFGVYEDFIRNIEENGYYIYHLPVSQQTQAEREQRKAPMFQIACKEAGAVHSANILIYVEP